MVDVTPWFTTTVRVEVASYLLTVATVVLFTDVASFGVKVLVVVVRLVWTEFLTTVQVDVYMVV